MCFLLNYVELTHHFDLLLCSVKGKSYPKNLLDTDSSLHGNVDGFYTSVKSRKLLLELYLKTLASTDRILVFSTGRGRGSFGFCI